MLQVIYEAQMSLQNLICHSHLYVLRFRHFDVCHSRLDGTGNFPWWNKQTRKRDYFFILLSTLKLELKGNINVSESRQKVI